MVNASELKDFLFCHLAWFLNQQGFRNTPRAIEERFELGLEEPEPGRALRSAFTIAISYIAGGIIPLGPYMLAANADQALRLSVALTLAALALFGYLKGRASGTPPVRSGLQTTMIGGLAAAAAFALAKAIS